MLGCDDSWHVPMAWDGVRGISHPKQRRAGPDGACFYFERMLFHIACGRNKINWLTVFDAWQERRDAYARPSNLVRVGIAVVARNLTVAHRKACCGERECARGVPEEMVLAGDGED